MSDLIKEATRDVSLANLAGRRVDYKLSTLFPYPFSFSLED